MPGTSLATRSLNGKCNAMNSNEDDKVAQPLHYLFPPKTRCAREKWQQDGAISLLAQWCDSGQVMGSKCVCRLATLLFLNVSCY